MERIPKRTKRITRTIVLFFGLKTPLQVKNCYQITISTIFRQLISAYHSAACNDRIRPPILPVVITGDRLSRKMEKTLD
jgi:hypothetical protein